MRAITPRQRSTGRAGLGIALVLALPWAMPTSRAQDAPRAKIASLLNTVESRQAADAVWQPSTLEQELAAGSGVRTGPGSRAGILYDDQTLQRLNENSELEILPAEAERPGLLRLLFGKHYFSSRRPSRTRRIETPTVVASIRGTEFVVEVAEDTTTTITLLEGVVEASNAFGSLTIQSGEQAHVEPGRAPQRRIVVRPRDAAAWALYYPAVFGGKDAEAIESRGEAGRSLARAAELLGAGQVTAAAERIEVALAERADDPLALALQSVVHVAANRRDEALAAAEAASAADPGSPAAALALSFAAQAAFDIPRARAAAELAAELDPDGWLALSRVAELRMAEGDLDGAESAARAAVDRNPRAGRALSVLGFAQLARLRAADAEVHFENAVATDSELAEARLGLGLARIRRGRLQEGREQIQLATLLDPGDALLRSYLAKAYYEERRNLDAGKELAIARELDPNDPTPFLYDAIRKQAANRPVEALADLRASIARNDNRAVYRSRLLLDEDLAVRGADLARIYNDLGFNRLGAIAARRAAAEDPSNSASHHLLAGLYRELPDFAPAFLSELLQARIYQPVGVNAARPDVVNESASFNEYTSLFERPRARLFAGGSYGTIDETATLPSALILDDPRFEMGELVGTLNGERYAAALAYSRSKTDGFRANTDDDVETYRGFVQTALSHRDSLQLNVVAGERERGDLPLRLFPAINSQARSTTDILNVGLGYHRILAPGSDLAVSLIHDRTEAVAPAGASVELEGPRLELQHVRRRARSSWVLGAGGFRGEARTRNVATPSEADDAFYNAYAYLHLRPVEAIDLTLGLSAERVVAPIGILTPPDSGFVRSGTEFSDARISPKLGLNYVPRVGTTIRAAAYHRLVPAIGRNQTLEPTQVAGFNQLFFDPAGTRAWSYGVGIDQELGSRWTFGASGLRRERTIPEGTCEFPNPLTRCQFRTVNGVAERDSEIDRASVYANVVILSRLVFAAEHSWERDEFDDFRPDNGGGFISSVKTRRARPELRLFLRSGLFVTAAGNYYNQRVVRTELFGAEVLDNAFWTLDADLGYRLPRRYGTLLLRGRNLTERDVPFFDRAIEDEIAPARTITFSFVLTL